MASIISAGTTSGTSLNLSGDTSGVLQLATNGSTTAVTVDTSQNVGIGTASPSNLLHVSQASSDFQARITGTSAANAGSIRTYNAGGEATGLGTTGSTNTGYGANLGFMGTITNIPQIFLTNNTERMRITSGGYVGINTTSPTNHLQVNGGISSTSNSPNFQASAAIMDFSASTARFNATGADNSTQGTLTFNTASANAGIFNERMRIDSSGRVTTPAQPAFMAYLNNSFTNASPQTIVFDITQFNTGSNYSTSTGRFTAPVTGLYQFNIVVLVQGSSATMHDFSLQVNGSNYKNGRINAPDSTVNYSCAIRLNANDYVSVYVSSTGRPIYGASDWTYFSGFLVG